MARISARDKERYAVRAALALRLATVTMHISKPIAESLESEFFESEKIWVEKKGVPWGTDWKKGLNSTLLSVILRAAWCRPPASGLGARADLQRNCCSEWYNGTINKYRGHKCDYRSTSSNVFRYVFFSGHNLKMCIFIFAKVNFYRFILFSI